MYHSCKWTSYMFTQYSVLTVWLLRLNFQICRHISLKLKAWSWKIDFIGFEDLFLINYMYMQNSVISSIYFPQLSFLLQNLSLALSLSLSLSLSLWHIKEQDIIDTYCRLAPSDTSTCSFDMLSHSSLETVNTPKINRSDNTTMPLLHFTLYVH